MANKQQDFIKVTDCAAVIGIRKDEGTLWRFFGGGKAGIVRARLNSGEHMEDFFEKMNLLLEEYEDNVTIQRSC